jgi:hypothetical protein
MESTIPQVEPIVHADADMDEAMAHLLKTSKWMKFMSILGFVFIGIMALVAVFCLFSARTFIEAAILALGIIIVIMPVVYLFNYARGVQKHGLTGTDEALEAAFENQRKLWVYYGIFMGVLFVIILGLVAFLGVNYTEALKHLR